MSKTRAQHQKEQRRKRQDRLEAATQRAEQAEAKVVTLEAKVVTLEAEAVELEAEAVELVELRARVAELEAWTGNVRERAYFQPYAGARRECRFCNRMDHREHDVDCPMADHRGEGES